MEHSPTLEAEIASLLLERLHVEVPSAHEDLIKTGLLDSLKIVELLAVLEQHFAMRIPLKEIEIHHFRSTESIADFVSHYIGCKEVPGGPSLQSTERHSRLPVAE
jgi:acyl carrier protein